MPIRHRLRCKTLYPIEKMKIFFDRKQNFTSNCAMTEKYLKRRFPRGGRRTFDETNRQIGFDTRLSVEHTGVTRFTGRFAHVVCENPIGGSLRVGTG